MRQGAGYDVGQWDDQGDLQAAGEALVTALRAQEDSRAISRGAAGILALFGPRFPACLACVGVQGLGFSTQSTLRAVAFLPDAILPHFGFTFTCAAHCCIPTHPGPLSASFLACQLTLLHHQATQTLQ